MIAARHGPDGEAAGPSPGPAAATEPSPADQQDQARGPIVTHAGGAAEEIEQQLARRRSAALRLPPMACGCRDPESPEHVAALCRYRRRVA